MPGSDRTVAFASVRVFPNDPPKQVPPPAATKRCGAGENLLMIPAMDRL